jgi:hypothetical protein
LWSHTSRSFRIAIVKMLRAAPSSAAGVRTAVPARAIDPVSGWVQIKHQAEVLGWPAIRAADRLGQDEVRATLEFRLGEEARRLARRCAEQRAPGSRPCATSSSQL